MDGGEAPVSGVEMTQSARVQRDAGPYEPTFLGPALKRIAVTSAIALVVLLGVRLAASVYFGRRLERTVHDIEARRGVLDPGRHAPPAVPDEENAAFAFQEAIKLLELTNEERTAMGRFSEAATAPPDDEVFEEASRIVQSNREALERMHESRRLPRSSWNVPYENGYRATVPNLWLLNSSTRLLRVEAELALRRSSPNEAAVALATSLRVASTLAREPLGLLQSLRVGVERRSAPFLARLLATPGLSPDLAQEIATLLDSLTGPDPIATGVLNEMRTYHATYVLLEETGLGSRWVFLPLFQRSHERWLRYHDACVSILQQPKANRPPFPRAPFSYFTLVRRPVPMMSRQVQAAAATAQRRDLLRIGFAVLRYRMDRGSYPSALEALVPAYLPSLPPDSGSGSPFRLEASATEVTIRGDDDAALRLPPV